MKYSVVPVKILFFDEVSRKTNEFLVAFHTDKPMTAFLTETLEDLIKTLMRKFICKDLCHKSCSKIAKLDFNNANHQKPTHLADLCFAVNHELLMQLWKSGNKITGSQILKFKKEAVGFSGILYNHYRVFPPGGGEGGGSPNPSPHPKICLFSPAPHLEKSPPPKVNPRPTNNNF